RLRSRRVRGAGRELLSSSFGRRGWREQRLPASTLLLDVAFATTSTGYVLAATGHGTDVHGTTDGGRSWRVLARLPNVFFERLIPGATTYAVGVSGLDRLWARHDRARHVGARVRRGRGARVGRGRGRRRRTVGAPAVRRCLPGRPRRVCALPQRPGVR